MAKQAKAKGNKVRNDNRKNGKADKKRPGMPHYHGEKPSEIQKVLWGKGAYARWKILGNSAPRRRHSSELDSDD